MDRRTVDSGNLNSGPVLAASATTNQADASTATGARDISPARPRAPLTPSGNPASVLLFSRQLP